MENINNEFTTQWWDTFLDTSKNLTKPTSIKNAFSGQTSTQLLEKTLTIFKSFDERAMFRVWVNDKQRDDLNKTLMNNPPQKNDTLESWTNRIFGKQKFGIIFNESESWNKELNIDIYKKVKPLLEKAGYPMMGMDLTIFIGNYGWTPLGIHIDYLGESVMHFHLGPTKKEMYLWDKKLYLNDLKGNLGEKRPEFFLDKATKFTINQGDIFYMPWGMPHIGKSDELSVGVSVWFNKPTKQKLISKITDNLNLEFINEKKTFFKEHDSFITNSEKIKTIDYQKNPLTNIFSELTNEFKKKDFLKETSFLELFKMATLDYQHSLKSSLNFSSPLFSSKEKKSPKIYNESLISMDNPYKIEWYHSDISSKLHLFIKGQKLMFNYSKDIIELVTRINQSKTCSVSELLQDLFIDFPKEVPLRIIELLYENDGISIKNIKRKKVRTPQLNNALITSK
ncbi:JmjC domain-containing protein [Aquimarina agarilytica]|uniref:JmjC domain-containing protein n=1 Tax=Aquimarina agarilytica TaxID=1087449 RepID=UPI0002895700|nr:cupin domain-containing protein [Aquimarina agarilytica]